MEAECRRAMERYADLLAEAGGDANPTAPCGAHWPHYWTRFAGRKGFLGEVRRLEWYERLGARAQ
jgi:transposase